MARRNKRVYKRVRAILVGPFGVPAGFTGLRATRDTTATRRNDVGRGEGRGRAKRAKNEAKEMGGGGGEGEK